MTVRQLRRVLRSYNPTWQVRIALGVQAEVGVVPAPDEAEVVWLVDADEARREMRGVA